MDSDTEPIDESVIDELRSSLSNQLSVEECEKLLEGYRRVFSSLKDYGKEHVVGAPLIDIHYVSIHSYSDSIVDDELEIYGSIQVTNGQGKTYYIYDQPLDDPDTVPFDGGYGELYLMDGEPIIPPFPVTKMDIHLMDKTKGIELAKGTLIWDYTERRILLEAKGEKLLECKNSIITVGYTTFEAAVVAHVDLELCKKNDIGDDSRSDCHDIDVFGDITASYVCDYSFAKPFSAALAIVGKENPIKMKLGTSIPLHKSIVAVPVYSSLKIQFSLRDLVEGYTLHTAQKLGITDKQIEGSNGYLINVRIRWRPGNPVKEMDWKPCAELNVHDDDPPSTYWVYKLSTIRNISPRTLTEVFSIVILPDQSKTQDVIVHLYGEIAVKSLLDEFYLFKRNESCLESFPCRKGKGKKLMMEGPYRHCFEGTRPGVRVKLKDNKGRLFCKGYLAWNETILDKYHTWYDRRLCSIIEGDYGLVKVHYSIFRKAVRATIIVSFSFDECSREFATNVHGSIFAHYGNYEYTSYDKDYYRSMLFLKSQESPLELFDGRKIPLSLLKSVISVPENSCLIIEVDLFASTKVPKPGGEALKGVAKFEFGIESCWRLRHEDFFIDVLVDWG